MTETLINQQAEVVINAIIDQAVNQAVNTAIQELRQNNLVKEGKTPYQKVEYLLYNYNNFKKGISNKQEKIDYIQAYGLGSKSKSITSYGGASGMAKDDEDKKQEAIEEARKSIEKTQRCINLIDDALLRLSKDKYYRIIPLWYFDNESREVIAEYFDVDTSTITRNKSHLVNKLKIILFSDEVIEEIFNPVS